MLRFRLETIAASEKVLIEVDGPTLVVRLEQLSEESKLPMTVEEIVTPRTDGITYHCGWSEFSL